MPSTNPLQAAFIKTLKSTALKAPWKILDRQIPYDPQAHSYPLRSNTMPAQVKLYNHILNVVRTLQTAGDSSNPTPFMLVTAKKTTGRSAYLETDTGTETIVSAVREIKQASGSTVFDVSLSMVDPQDASSRTPVATWPTTTGTAEEAVLLALMPYILHIDQEKGNGILARQLMILETGLKDCDSWTDKNDVPEQVRNALYCMEAVLEIVNQMEIRFAASGTTSIPDEVQDNFLDVPGRMVGSLFRENRVNGWSPRFVSSNGKRSRMDAKKITISDAKAQFAAYAADRQWSSMEKMLIPSFPEDMPVMEETLRMAERICNTQSDTNPVVNLMWRSDTGYGKSTGTKQLACILNMPYLCMTCHPGMEVQEFKSTLVPAACGDTELDMSTVTLPTDPASEPTGPLPPYFSEAMAHLSAMDAAERESLLDASSFYSQIFMADPEDLLEKLTGKKETISAEDLCWLYTAVNTEIGKAPLKQTIRKLQATEKEEPAAANQKDQPAFVHVLSNYVKAMVNGYVCEIQEASRIRDSGVLVGLNEFDRPGAAIPLLNGALARRHKKAICIITDNVGYNSCRPIDPSVLRRQSLIIDSAELTKKELLDRVRFNTHCTDEPLLEQCWTLWNKVKEFCRQNSITEGSTSPVELERFVQAMLCDGAESLQVNLDDCVISKATSNWEDQRSIRDAVWDAN